MRDWLLKVGGGSRAFYQFSSIPEFLSSLLTSEYQLLSSNNVRGTCKKSRGVLNSAGSDARNNTLIRAVTAEMCAVESSGTLYLGGETMKVTDGQFLLSVMVEGWQQEGSFLEFNLTVAVPDGYKISTNSSTAANVPVKVSLGTNDSFVMISSKVSRNNHIHYTSVTSCISTTYLVQWCYHVLL